VFNSGGDMCLTFFAQAYEEDWLKFPRNARVLEIGCAEADWQTPMLAIRPDLQITGIDWREVLRPGETIRGDVMNLDTFDRASFDAIVSISAIEHVGLGAYNDDPLLPSGDLVAMNNALYWLKPGGWMYLDVPYRPTGVFEVHDNFRAYNQKALHDRLTFGFEVERWAKCETPHPDGPYIAMLLRKP
jgi:SAM-dependent methyltransferase